MENSSLIINYGDKTEKVLKSILKEIDDDMLDEIAIDRKIETPEGLASEPITIAVTVTASSVLIIHITRLIERWLESRRQADARKMLITASNISKEALEAMKELEEKHADVAISYQLSKQSDKK